MGNLYKVLSTLCDERKITAYKMCKDVGMQPSIMTDLKMGRRSSVKAETADRLATYFGVSVGYLLGNETGPSNEGPEKPKLRSIARLEEMSLSPDEDEKIAEFIELLLKRKNDKK